jgi:hypothetical protein
VRPRCDQGVGGRHHYRCLHGTKFRNGCN